MPLPRNRTTWGEGEPQEAKDQLIEEQSSISLVSTLILTVTSNFLVNLLAPAERGVENFPSEKEYINWIMVDSFAISTFALLFATFLSVFLSMALNEVGTSENALVLCRWLGDWATLLPMMNLIIGMGFFIFGAFIWLFAIFPNNFMLKVKVVVVSSKQAFV